MVEETSVSVLEFIVNLCAIVGGAITILRFGVIVDSSWPLICLYLVWRIAAFIHLLRQSLARKIKRLTVCSFL